MFRAINLNLRCIIEFAQASFEGCVLITVINENFRSFSFTSLESGGVVGGVLKETSPIQRGTFNNIKWNITTNIQRFEFA